MILIALGSNMPGCWGTPVETLEHARDALNMSPLHLERMSSIHVTKPFGPVVQPDFLNAIARIATDLSPEELMAKLHALELAAGRVRAERWGPRSLDLDIIDYHGLTRTGSEHSLKPLWLPHPGIAERRFVLEPLLEVAPDWRHPLSHETAAELLKKLR